MAIYHCSVKVIGRNSGRSSVAAAAYRSGEKLLNEYDGVEHDFTRKNWVEYTNIILPDNAPKEYANRSTLWNAVEKIERAKDAQLCREFELALPIEMTKEQQIKIVEKFAEDKLIAQGMVVDIAIHNPPVTNDRHQPVDEQGKVTNDVTKMQFINPHAHILATVRPLDEHGKWQKKSQIEYVCKCGESEKNFTAQEFKIAKENGWQKQYKFLDGKKKVWLTEEEGRRRELERVNRSPKTSPYGRKNKIVDYWNSKERIFEWRQYWEKVVNDEFSRNLSDIRIDSRSFKQQGRNDELPTLHMGTAATNMEKRAKRELQEGIPEQRVEHSDIGNINREIKEHNQFVRLLKEKVDAAVAKAKHFVSGIARRIEGLRVQIISNNYNKSVLTQKLNMMESELLTEKERLEKFKMEFDKVNKTNETTLKEVEQLKKEKMDCSPLQFLKKNNLQKQIQDLKEQMENRNEYINNVGKMCGYKSVNDYQKAEAKYIEKYKDYEQMQKEMDKLQSSTKDLTSKYRTELAELPTSSFEKIEQERAILRDEIEEEEKEKLRENHKSDFKEEKYKEASKRTDNNLEGKQSVSNEKKVDVIEKDIIKRHKLHH